MRVPAWLPRAATSVGDRPALVDSAGTLTYAQLDARAAAAAGALAAAGVAQGDRVGLALPAGRGFVANSPLAFSTWTTV